MGSLCGLRSLVGSLHGLPPRAPSWAPSAGSVLGLPRGHPRGLPHGVPRGLPLRAPPWAPRGQVAVLSLTRDGETHCSASTTLCANEAARQRGKRSSRVPGPGPQGELRSGGLCTALYVVAGSAAKLTGPRCPRGDSRAALDTTKTKTERPCRLLPAATRSVPRPGRP